MVSIGNHPQMAELFRLVKYYNFPRIIVIVGLQWVILVNSGNKGNNPLLTNITPLFNSLSG